jgi:hypothetical protein
MPQRDCYHEVVKALLIADGWTITHDPYYVTLGERRGYIDLGAEQPIAAQQGERIVAERHTIGSNDCARAACGGRAA